MNNKAYIALSIFSNNITILILVSNLSYYMFEQCYKLWIKPLSVTTQYTGNASIKSLTNLKINITYSKTTVLFVVRSESMHAYTKKFFESIIRNIKISNGLYGGEFKLI